MSIVTNTSYFRWFIIVLSTLLSAKCLMNDTIDCKSEILKCPYVHMKNESAVLEKIKKIISKGVDKLQIVTDFDQTLTKQQEDGERMLNSFEVFFRSKQLPQSKMEDIPAVSAKLNAVILLDPTLPTVSEEKRVEVFKKVYAIIQQELQGFEYDRKEIAEVVRKHGPPFRNRTNELFTMLKNFNIPVVINSGGLTDVIEEHLKQGNINYDNIQIIANPLKFNGSMLDGLQNYEKFVTPFNKHEHFNQIRNSEVLKNRKNVILMGDNIGDTTIVRDFENEGTVLKIGFTYKQTDESFKIFKDSFDIVLDDDQTMNVVLDILKLF